MLALRAKRADGPQAQKEYGELAQSLLALFAAHGEYRSCAEQLKAEWRGGTILDFYA